MYKNNSKSISRILNGHDVLYSLFLLALVTDKCYSSKTDLMNVRSHHFKNSRKLISISDGVASNVFNVEDFGALGDGNQDNTQEFAAAWNAACISYSATMVVPSDKTFLVNNIVFKGPCVPGFTFQIDGTILAHRNPERWNNTYMWLAFQQLQNFTLTGVGSINGQGDLWWQDCNAVQFFRNCNVTVSGLTIKNSPLAHLTFDDCENIKVHDIKISSPGDSRNTDGIDVGSSKNFAITDSIIVAGDDCIAFGNGCSEMLVRNLTCGPGHGISIGSLGKYNSAANVSNITVEGAKLTGTMNGARIKTWQGGSGTVSNIKFKNIEMVYVSNPIIIDQYYCASSTPMYCTNQTSAVQISNVRFENIYGISLTPAAVKFACSDTVACTDIILSNIYLKLESHDEAYSFCENAYGQIRENVDPPSCLKSDIFLAE
ncbi:hypothetical protein SUGI_0122170 [Cryptomeria japonica]|nr:hypothetical protein SUGI_0122170 [Cryptomeria japonica]